MKGVSIEGLRPYDGEWPLDLAHMKAVEYGLIKRLSGYLPADLTEGLAGLDMELIAAIGVVALQRNGQVADNDGEAQAKDVYARLIQLEPGKVRLDLGADDQDEEGDAVPPILAPGESGGSSGPGSKQSSATSTHLPRVGGTGSSASAGLRLARSGT